jgi:DNA-binding CsgD family transcriptional regulator
LGLSASGDAFWLQPSDWNAFLEYEADLTKTIADKPITLLCTYPLSASKSGDIFDVACAHQFAIAKRKKRWEVIKGWGWGQERKGWGEERVEPLDAANRTLSLSRRERQVLDGLIEGRPSKVIAYDLGISARTVDVHRARLLDRLNVRTTAEAVGSRPWRA